MKSQGEHYQATARASRSIASTPSQDPVSRVLDLQRLAGNRATTLAIQRFRVGLVPNQAWRDANVGTDYSDLTTGARENADFTAGTKQAVLAHNAQQWAGDPTIVAAPGPAGGPKPVSDTSSTQLMDVADAATVTPEVDHIVRFRDWGSNDSRNARVISKRENTDPALARPAFPADTELIALEQIPEIDGDVEAGNALNLDQVNELLEMAREQPIANLNALTEGHIEAIYNRTRQQRRQRRGGQ